MTNHVKKYILFIYQQPYVIPLGLFILSFIIRLCLISKGPYHDDCLRLAIQAEKTLDTFQLQRLFGSGYPLTIILGAFFIFLTKFFGNTDPVFAVNFMSVTLSALCAPVLYKIAQCLFNKNTGLLSSIIFSICPIFLSVSVYGKSHTPSILFLLLGIWYLMQYHAHTTKKNLFLSSLFIGCMGAARLQDMILMMPALIFLFLMSFHTLNKKTLKSAFDKKAFYQLIPFLMIIGFVIILFHIPYLFDESKKTNTYQNQFAHFWFLGVTNNFSGFFSPYLFRSLGYLNHSFTPLGLGISTLGLIFLLIKQFRLGLFLLLWILCPLLFYGHLHTSVPRFFAFITPPLALSIGFLLSHFIDFSRPARWISLFIFCVLITVMLYSITPILYDRHKNAYLPDFARWVSQQTEPNARLIVSDDSLFFKYYGQRSHIKRVRKDNALISDNELLDFKKRVDEFLNNNTPVYITFTGLHTYNKDKKFSSFILKHYDLEYIGEHPYEDWHRGELKQIIIWNKLFRLTSKHQGTVKRSLPPLV